MAKTVFVPGQALRSIWVNAIQNLQFDDTDADGHYPRLTDDNLSGVTGNIKPDFRAFKNALQVSIGTGLSVSYLAGSVRIPDGSLVIIPPGNINLPANTTVTIYVNNSGGIVFSTPDALPVTRFDLATVLTGSSSITSVTDLRVYNIILPDIEAVKTFGGSGSQGDLTISNTRTFDDGEYWFRNLTIAETGVLNISSAVRIYCSGNFTCAGLVNVSPCISGGASQGGAGGATVESKNGNGAGGASSYIAAPPYNYILSPVGSGGATGVAVGTNFFAGFGAGGSGGGSFYVEAGGNISITSTSTISAKGGNAGAGFVTSSTVLTGVTGSGAGSGGSTIFKALGAIVIQGTIDVRGGNGGDAVYAVNSTYLSIGGGAGGGGTAVLIAPTITTTSATIRLDPGINGASINPAGTNPLGGGAGGSFGGRGANAGSPLSGNVATAGRLTVRNLVASV